MNTKPQQLKTQPEERDVFDSKDFDVINYINQRFPDEASLQGLDEEINKLRTELSRLDEDILSNVHEHSLMNANIKEEIEASTKVTEKIVEEIDSIKNKAIESENLVEEMCKDIRLLDLAKKNLTVSIQMLQKYLNAMDSLDQLRDFCEKRQYRDVINTILGINDLLAYFSPYQNIPQVKELMRDRDDIQKNLMMQVIEDYELFFQEQTPEKDFDIIRESGELAEVLGTAFRNQIFDLINKQISKLFKQIFTQPENHKVEAIPRMFTWFNKTRRDYTSKFLPFLPSYWGTECYIVQAFCSEARIMISDILEQNKYDSSTPVTELLKSMKTTVEFEKKIYDELRSDYMQYTTNVDEFVKTFPEEIRKSKRSFVLGLLPKIKGTISDSFEFHMTPYIQMEEADLNAQIKKAWDSDMGDLTRPIDLSNELNKLLKSSIMMFNLIKPMLQRANRLSRSQTMLGICEALKRSLRLYRDEIVKRAQFERNNTKNQKSSQLFEQNMCLLINTSDYSKKTIASMSETIASMLDEAFAVTLTFEPEMEYFTESIGIIYNLMGEYVGEKLSAIFEKFFFKVNWERLNSIGDVSEYVKEAKLFLGAHTNQVRLLMESGYTGNYLYKVCSITNEIFINSFCKLKKFGEYGIQQLQTDFFELKMEVLNVGKDIGGGKGAATLYFNFASRETQKTENILKLLAMQNNEFLENFKIFIEKPTPQMIEKIFTIKGFKKPEITQYIAANCK